MRAIGRGRLNPPESSPTEDLASLYRAMVLGWCIPAAACILKPLANFVKHQKPFNIRPSSVTMPLD
eukprot:16445103-Heterocapsa_arctica.AAC.1